MSLLALQIPLSPPETLSPLHHKSMRPGWFAELLNPWELGGLVDAIDRSKPVDGPNEGRRTADEAGL